MTSSVCVALVFSAATALVLRPAPLRPTPARALAARRVADARADSLYANDGGESGVDWDAEAAALAKPTNAFYKAIKDTPVPELIAEFAETAPDEVQDAVRATVRQLLGNVPENVAAITRMTTGQNVASLMFSMQMTGYMFRNAQYRKSLVASLDGGEEQGGGAAPAALPSVAGTISVELGSGMKAEVDAAAYMQELRGEVEALRAQLAAAKQAQPEEGAGGLIAYVQSLQPDEVKQLSQSVGQEVLDAMAQLIDSILREANVPKDAVMEASDAKMRELLVWQLVTGYKLRELEVKEEIKDKYWGTDAAGA